MSLNDDESIVATPYDSGTKYETLREGDIQVTTIYKEETGLDESHLSVFLEVTGAGYENERPGVDIVTVLDISDSMKGEKLETLKGVMRLLIDKLSSADRLSIVTVSNDPRKLCGLRQMSIVSRAEIEKLVSGLETYPGKDIYGGLDMAFNVISDRTYATRRRVAVLLMSDGDHVQVPSNHVSFETLPVYTFGFGRDHNSMVLNDIAKRSDGGIYCALDVRNSSPSNMTRAISECLTNLFTIVVSDLKLTFKRAKSTAKIVNVCVGTYACSYIPFTTDDDHVIVPYGDLFANETCKIKVDLLLPRVADQQRCDLLHVSYSYRTTEEVFHSSSRLISVTRKMDNLSMYFGNERLFAVGGNDIPNENINFQEVDDDLPIELNSLDSRNTMSISSGEQNINIEEIQSSNQAEVDENELVDKVDYDQSQGIQMKKSDTKMYELLKQAFDSVKLIRGILNNYVDQYVGFQANAEASNADDLVRSQNVKALGDHIRLTFDSVKAIEDILQNVENIAPCVINLEGENINVKPLEGENGNGDPLEEEQGETQVEVSEEHEEINDNMKYMSDRVKQAFESIQIIRGILNDYVDKYIGFQASEGALNDLDRSQNIKALGDHIRLTFDSVKAIEDILQNVESIPSCPINLEGGNINEDKPLEEEQAETQVEPHEEHEEVNVQVEHMSDHIKQAFDSVQIIRGILSDYVKHHTEFEDENGYSNDPVRSTNVKALGDHLQRAFYSVEAIEEVLIQCA